MEVVIPCPVRQAATDRSRPRRQATPLQVLLTVDTEVWPRYPDWQADNLARDLERDIEGKTKTGSFGLEFQLQLLQAHNLRAIFFVEGLVAETTGLPALER